MRIGDLLLDRARGHTVAIPHTPPAKHTVDAGHTPYVQQIMTERRRLIVDRSSAPFPPAPVVAAVQSRRSPRRPYQW
jgi:hypothetical protein